MTKRAKFLTRIVRLETQREDHERIHELEEKARAIAFSDMNRRLMDHNEILDKWDKDRATFIERPWFEKVHKDLEESTNARFEEQERRMRVLEGFHSGESGRQGPIGDLIKWGAALLAMIIMFLVGHFSFK